MKSILCTFPISSDEYRDLEKAFGKLCYKASWELLKKNTNNNHQYDTEDIYQELIFSVVKAGSYHKRQVFIKKCLEVAKKFSKDIFILVILEELNNLWDNRTRHGANRQRFGLFQEKLLNKIVESCVPKEEQPSDKDKLKIDAYFSRYAKQILWNQTRSIGKKITREKPLRVGMASLSEFDYLGGEF